ncbi:MAG TPA: chemotaxis protein CheB [Roseiflexaceae bacterium]|nr:chemotaxis protein CheB [Roseiflexaceae bacterium]
MDAQERFEAENQSIDTTQTLPSFPKSQPSFGITGGAQANYTAAAYVVGIGASAGGLEMFEEFFAHMPAKSGLAFVVVTHLHPEYTSFLPELIGPYTSMPVLLAEHGAIIEANTVYIIPPSFSMTIDGSRLHLAPFAHVHSKRHTIDHFLFSLAEEYAEHAIGVILSGAGNDGAAGIAAIKAAGGRAVVQDSTTARYADMPQSAIDTGLVDMILAVPDMPARILEYLGISVPPEKQTHDRPEHAARFFRDIDTLKRLERSLPTLFAKHTSTTPLRIWIIGCGTGEEAYTIAIMLHEYMRLRSLSFGLQIFASDESEQAIACAPW